MATPHSAGKLPPGSLGLPFLGETLSFALNNHAFFRKRFEKYGPVFKTRLFGKDIVVFIGPEAFPFFAEAPQLTREDGNPPQVQKLLDWDSLPLIDGEKHRTRKRLILEAFRPEALDRYLPSIEAAARSYLQKWERLGEFTWLPEYKKFSATLSGALLLGWDPTTPADELAAEIEGFFKGFTALPVDLRWNTYGRALRNRDKLLARISEAIREHRHRRFPDMLSELIEARVEGLPALTDEEILCEVLHIIFAAYTGAFAALTLLSLGLAQHPEAMARAREEVRQQAPEGPLRYETLQRLGFLDRTTREIRRFFPTNSNTFFARVKDPIDFHGFHVPAGWRAVGGIYTTLKDPKAFADPDRFDPDRFEPGHPGQQVASCWVPHGGGPREGHRCAGEDLVTVLMKAMATLLLRDYTWEMPPQDASMSHDFFPVPRSGLRVKFQRERR